MTGTTPPLYSETELRVRYAETDKMGVVYYANYLVWMEVARTDFCLHAGFRYSDMENNYGVMIAVAEARCRYRRPARYDDRIRVRTTLTRLGRRTMTFDYAVFHAVSGELLADGATTHVSVNLGGRPTAIPDEEFRLLAAKVIPVGDQDR
jgi:acyl-CoA thioester hydrolase